MVNINEENLLVLESKVLEKAEELYKSSKVLFENSFIAFAYAHLVFCMEEVAKRQGILLYKRQEHLPNDWQRISGSKFNKLFSKHESKHLTIVTQLILGLTNTFDKKKINIILKSIEEEDPNICHNIKEILIIFKRMWEKRNKALYVDKDISNPGDICKKDYLKLEKYVKIALYNVNTFRSIKNCTYDQLEEKIKRMLERV